MVKILFLIHDLGQGGAEKVLVNLVNNMDATKFDISVTALFGGGVNEQFLKPHIHFRAVFPKNFRGNIHLMKLLSPKQLHKLCVREHYDIEVSYLEGPSARVVSGCTDSKTKKICWIHAQQQGKQPFLPFRGEAEAQACYRRFDEIVCVVLTGMGADGTNGILSLGHHKPIHVISQSAETCIVYGMPKAIAETGIVNEVVPLDKVASTITKNVGVQ